MKLRLENGNFGIKATWDEDTEGYNCTPLPTGLKPIDFIGSVICYSGPDFDFFNTVINASPDANNQHVVDLMHISGNGNPVALYYNPLNGKVGETIPDIVDDDSSGSDDSGFNGGIK